MTFYAGQKVRASNLNDLLSVDAKYSAASNQSIPTSTDTVIAYGTANRTSTLVTRAVSGAGHSFTLNRAGLWAVTATTRYGSTAASGEWYHAIVAAGAIEAAQGHIGPAIAGSRTINASVTTYFPAGSIVTVNAWQSSGGAVNTDAGNPGWVSVHLAWITS
jgi:hypothetical protein